MSFSFTAGTAIRALRVLIGDRWEVGHLVEDEELTELLAGGTDADAVRTAAIPAIGLAIAAAAYMVTRTTGDDHAKYSDLAGQLRARLDDLIQQGYPTGVSTVASGPQTYERPEAVVTGDRDFRW